MNVAAKAVLLSALVCPGAGHIQLGRRTVGITLISISIIALCALMSVAFTAAISISELINTWAIKTTQKRCFIRYFKENITNKNELRQGEEK